MLSKRIRKGGLEVFNRYFMTMRNQMVMHHFLIWTDLPKPNRLLSLQQYPSAILVPLDLPGVDVAATEVNCSFNKSHALYTRTLLL